MDRFSYYSWVFLSSQELFVTSLGYFMTALVDKSSIMTVSVNKCFIELDFQLKDRRDNPYFRNMK